MEEIDALERDLEKNKFEASAMISTRFMEYGVWSMKYEVWSINYKVWSIQNHT